MLVINEEIGFEYICCKFWVGKISYGDYRATCLNLRFLRLELFEDLSCSIFLLETMNKWLVGGPLDSCAAIYYSF